MKKKNHQNLKDVLKKMGTQEEIACKLNVQQSVVSKYINNISSPSIRMILKLCVASGANLLPEQLNPEEDWQFLYEFIGWYNDHFNNKQ